MASHSTPPIIRTITKNRSSAHPGWSRSVASLELVPYTQGDVQSPIVIDPIETPESDSADHGATDTGGIESQRSDIVGDGVNIEDPIEDADPGGPGDEAGPNVPGNEDNSADPIDDDDPSSSAYEGRPNDEDSIEDDNTPSWSNSHCFEGIYMSKINKTPATILMSDGGWHIDKWTMDDDTAEMCQTWPGDPDEVTVDTKYPVYMFMVRYPMNNAAREMLDDHGDEGMVVDVIGPTHWTTRDVVHDILMEARNRDVPNDETE